ncbi:MAG: hypothetical protein ACLP50_24080 [Solirubrobacteraceae bacterium]
MDSGRASSDTVDNLGEQIGALDPIPDPAGGYVGVYHTPFGPFGVGEGNRSRLQDQHRAFQRSHPLDASPIA